MVVVMILDDDGDDDEQVIYLLSVIGGHESLPAAGRLNTHAPLPPPTHFVLGDHRCTLNVLLM